MLTRVDVVTAQGTTLSLPLQDTSAGFVVKDILGLDPVKSTIVSSKFAQIDGTKRQSSSRENRNIVLKMGFAPNYATTDIRTLRNYLYGYLMPKSSVLLKFYMDNVFFAQIQGEVESCEAPMFSKEPEVAISLVCFDPDFSFSGTLAASGNTQTYGTPQAIAYSGTSPVGVKLTMSINRSVSSFAVYQGMASNGSGATVASLSGTFLAGDFLEFLAMSGLKGMWVTRSSVKSSWLYGVYKTSVWTTLYPGTNYVQVVASGAAIPWNMYYTPKYGAL